MVPKLIIFPFVFLVHMSTSMGLLCIQNEREALLSLKQGFIDESGRLSSWGTGENQHECCSWEGVLCSNRTGHVLKLDLHSNEFLYTLQGMISPSLAELHHLNYLDLSVNYFNERQNIPKFVGSLTHLKYLNLSYCGFEGKFPNEFGNLIHLQYLDLGGNELDGEFPSQLLNLSHLKHLDLSSYRYFYGVIPHQIGNLSHLQYLHIGALLYGVPPYLRSNLQWVSYLSSSLTTLKLQGVDLSANSHNWLRLISNLPLLNELGLINCNLSDNIPSLSFSTLNISHSLAIIDFSVNNLTSSIFEWLLNFKSSLAILDLSFNKLHDGMPKSLWDICSLRELSLDRSNLTGLLQDFLPNFPQCAHKSLKVLRLGSNQISGTVPESIGHLSELETLYVRENSLTGMVTEVHFSNLSELNYLDLSLNALVLNISADWVPPFQLKILNLNSIKVGPSFPMWLRTQTHYQSLDMSHSQISDTIPHWFWSLSTHVESLDLCCNQIGDEISSLQINFSKQPEKVDLSSNLFIGQIPSFLSAVESLLLNDNKFTELSSFLCTGIANQLHLLNLSNNHLYELPDCWKNFQSLRFLNLDNNNISGRIPVSMGFLINIRVLLLRNNNLTGEIPMSLSNYKELAIFDVGYNKLFGPIPTWIGDKLQNLAVFILKFNQFHGAIPMNICFLTSLQILDLSHNNISGSIPSCLNRLTAMANQTLLSSTYDFWFPMFNNFTVFWLNFFDANIMVTWKTRNLEYKSNLGLLKIMDLSSNKFEGVIPYEIMDLIGLLSLNISRNMLHGYIPSTVGQMKSLEALDLSRNFLHGTIPSSLSQLSFLSMLDLACNNLSGAIPKSTQIQSIDATSFMGNPELCGDPLPKSCANRVIYEGPSDGNDSDDNQIIDRGFYISMALGFIVGFWGIFGSLYVNKSWRQSYFKLLRDMYDWLYVHVALNIAKLQRMFNGLKGTSKVSHEDY